MVRWNVELNHQQFVAQKCAPSIAGLYNYASSALLHVAHRRLGARTQSRVEVAPGSCLLRGESARELWTLAIPPLLSTTTTRDSGDGWDDGGGHGSAGYAYEARTRSFAVLVDRSTSSATVSGLGEVGELDVQEYRPRY